MSCFVTNSLKQRFLVYNFIKIEKQKILTLEELGQNKFLAFLLDNLLKWLIKMVAFNVNPSVS